MNDNRDNRSLRKFIAAAGSLGVAEEIVTAAGAIFGEYMVGQARLITDPIDANEADIFLCFDSRVSELAKRIPVDQILGIKMVPTHHFCLTLNSIPAAETRWVFCNSHSSAQVIIDYCEQFGLPLNNFDFATYSDTSEAELLEILRQAKCIVGVIPMVGPGGVLSSNYGQHVNKLCRIIQVQRVLSTESIATIYRWVLNLTYQLEASIQAKNKSLEQEIAERKKAEETLRFSEVRYRTLMEQSFEALAVIDIQTQQVMEVNHQFTELLGYSLPEDAPLYVNQFVVDSQSNLDRFYNIMLKQQRTLPIEARIFRHKNGIEVPVERAVTHISVGGRDLYLASMRDMTAERRRQAELTRDVEFARRVQRGLLPELPESPFVILRTLYHPSHFVSGDSYHLEWSNEGRLLRGFLIDVSGHGLATAIQTSSINVLLREAATSPLPLLAQIHQINARAAKYFTNGAYAAILGFELDLSLRELRYVGAGITQFYANGKKVETPGMFVGMWDDAEFIAGTLPITPGDCFHFLTDGYTDWLAHPENDGFWSPDGKDFDADVIALKRLADSGKLRDDATAVCLKIKRLL